MKYTFLKTISKESITWQNEMMTPRAFFVPCSDRAHCSGEPFATRSDRVRSLAGEWDFIYSNREKHDVKDGEEWGKITVPSSWESAGLVLPGTVKREDFSEKNFSYGGKEQGVYRTRFDIDDLNYRYTLTFQKVYGTLEVYLNGKFCGYSLFKHGEFDITDLMKEQNELVVVVHKNSCADGVHCGEKLSSTGIVGDVLLTRRPNTGLFDYSFRATKEKEGFCGNLYLTFSEEANATVTLQDGDLIVSEATVDGLVKANVAFTGDFRPYSAEQPYLYTAYVRVFDKDGKETECTALPIGFSDIRIDGGVATINEKPLKIKGVDYRSEYTAEGNLMTAEEYRSELCNLKSFNFNTVMTVCPMEPIFGRICASVGLYWVDGFGFDASFISDKTSFRAGRYLNGMPIYTTEYALRVFYRDRACPALVGFSFGKEGDNVAFSIAAKRLEESSSVPVFYKGGKIVCPYGADKADVLTQCALHSDSPLFLPDYIDCKEVSEDRFDEFFDLIDSVPQCMGGTVKEYRDIISNGIGFEGRGLFTSGNLPYSSAILGKYLARPFRSEMRDNRWLDIYNENAFAVMDCEVVINLVYPRATVELKRFYADIPAGEMRTYEIFIGKLGNDLKVEVNYYEREGGGHIATEIFQVYTDEQPIPPLPKCRTYAYRLSGDMTNSRTLPPRSFFLPCSAETISNKTDFSVNASDRVSVLDEWQFCYGEEMQNAVLFADSLPWQNVTVPFAWESRGCATFGWKKGYTFPHNGSKTAFNQKNPNITGVYRKIITVADISFDYILSVEGIHGELSVYVNGTYIGTALTADAEFPLNEQLVSGDNEILLALNQYGKNSFLDAGEHFFATGILGEVKLIRKYLTGLTDCAIKTEKTEDGFRGEIRLTFDNPAEAVQVQLKKDGKLLFSDRKEGAAEMNFAVQGDYEPYSLENPLVYDMYVKVIKNGFVAECDRFPMAFIDVTVDRDTVLVNGSPLKIRGAVYNALYRADGIPITERRVEEDLLLLKEYGFNAVCVTSPSARFLERCLRIGLYVIEKMPIETEKEVGIADSDEFSALILDAVRSAYEKGKNFSNVMMYLFGESAQGKNIRASIEYLHSVTNRPVAAPDDGDVCCLFRPTVSEAFDRLNECMNRIPLFFAEYAAQEGVGSTDTKRFEDVVINNSCALGGCIVRFTNDIICGQGNRSDGLFLLDRTPTAGAQEVKMLFRPVRSTLSERNRLVIENRRQFVDTSDLILRLCVMKKGKMTSQTTLEPIIPPTTAEEFGLSDIVPEGDTLLNVEYYSKKTEKLLYTEQHPLARALTEFSVPAGKGIAMDEGETFVDVRFESGEIRFQKTLGTITRYAVLDKEYLRADSVRNGANCFENNLTRPFLRTLKEPKAEIERKVKTFACEQVGNRVVVLIESEWTVGKKSKYEFRDKYTVLANGTVEVLSMLKHSGKVGALDCFGKKIRLHNGFGDILYYGMGPEENYIDLCDHARMGIYPIDIEKVYAEVSKPQECGNREGVRYAIARDKDGDGLMFVAAGAPFAFRASMISDEQIRNGGGEGVFRQSGIYLDIDAFVSGIGNSQEGEPQKKYTFADGEYTLTFKMIPLRTER